MDSGRFLLSQPEPIGSPLMSDSRNLDDDANILESNFDTNMVIILAALLLALICTLGLNSVVRYALRCSSSNRLAVDPSERESPVSSLPYSIGIKKIALNQIPVVVYGSGGGEGGEQRIPTTTTETECCTICLVEFVDGEKIRVLPKCNHEFHVPCIDPWLKSHSSCPNCRYSLLERPPPPPTTSRASDTDALPL